MAAATITGTFIPAEMINPDCIVFEKVVFISLTRVNALPCKFGLLKTRSSNIDSRVKLFGFFISMVRGSP